MINLLAACLLALNLMAPASAAEWVEVSQSAANKVYIDKTSIAKDKVELVTYSMKIEYAKPVRKKRMPVFTSKLLDVAADCKTAEILLRGGSLLFEGSVVAATPGESRFIRPGGYEMDAFVYVCHKARLDSITSSLGQNAPVAEPEIADSKPAGQARESAGATPWVVSALLFALVSGMLWLRFRARASNPQFPVHKPMWEGTLYYALDVARKASDKQILAGYQRQKEALDAQEHKDAETTNKQIFLEYAKEVLLDPAKRAEYDRQIGH
jgi:hypothetical protein